MLFDRRRLLAGLCALASVGGSARAAGPQDRGLFWRATPPGTAPSILFGYDAVAASVASEIYAIGDRLAAPSRRLIVDVPTVRTTSQPQRIDLGKPQTLADRFGPATAQRLVAILSTAFPAAQNIDKLASIPIVFAFFFEGRTPVDAASGGALPARLFARIAETGEPISYLYSADEVAHPRFASDVQAAEPQIHAPLMEYLLELRSKIGPIGKYAETTYLVERPYELFRMYSDLEQHGLPQFLMHGAPDLVDRAVRAIMDARNPTFLMVPFGNFVRDDGILARLKKANVAVETAG